MLDEEELITIDITLTCGSFKWIEISTKDRREFVWKSSDYGSGSYFANNGESDLEIAAKIITYVAELMKKE